MTSIHPPLHPTAAQYDQCQADITAYVNANTSATSTISPSRMYAALGDRWYESTLRSSMWHAAALNLIELTQDLQLRVKLEGDTPFPDYP